MASLLGPARRQALQTRRSPLKVGQMVCTACSRGSTFVRVVPCRVLHESLLRPGVRCPQCHTAWIEAEDQPEVIAHG